MSGENEQDPIGVNPDGAQAPPDRPRPMIATLPPLPSRRSTRSNKGQGGRYSSTEYEQTATRASNPNPITPSRAGGVKSPQEEKQIEATAEATATASATSATSAAATADDVVAPAETGTATAQEDATTGPTPAEATADDGTKAAEATATEGTRAAKESTAGGVTRHTYDKTGNTAQIGWTDRAISTQDCTSLDCACRANRREGRLIPKIISII